MVLCWRGKVEDEILQSEATGRTESEAEAFDDDPGKRLTFGSEDGSATAAESEIAMSRSFTGKDIRASSTEYANPLEEWSFIDVRSYYGHGRDPTLQSFLRKLYIESSPYMADCSGPTLPCQSVPFARNPTFFGREEALADAARVLCPSFTHRDGESSPNVYTYPRTHAITGPGGMDKTQVACEFVYRHREEFDIILWIHADDKPSPFQDFNEKNLKDEQSERASWLLIYDSVDDSPIINEFWPYDGPGSILITRGAHSHG